MHRRLAEESMIIDQHRSCSPVIDLITKAEMLSSVMNLGVFYSKMVKKFIVNLPTNFNESGTPDFQKVHVRGKCFDVSPTFIELLLERVCACWICS